MGMRASQELAVGHARQDQIVGVLGLAGHLGPGVDLGQRLPDDGEALLLHDARLSSTNLTLASPGSSPPAPRPRLGSIFRPSHARLPGSSPPAPPPRLGPTFPPSPAPL